MLFILVEKDFKMVEYVSGVNHYFPLTGFDLVYLWILETVEFSLMWCPPHFYYNF